jgi:hypothetical protein
MDKPSSIYPLIKHKTYCHMPSALSSIFNRIATGAALILVVTATASLSGCTPDNKSETLGPLPKASFTIDSLAGVANTFVATAATTGIFEWYWSTSGAGGTSGPSTDTIHFSKKGNYRLTLTAVGPGGYDTASQVVSVPNDDLGNTVIQGGFLNTASASAWTLLSTGGTTTNFTFGDDGVVLDNGTSGTANTNGGIYQAIQVQTGHTYTFSANVQGIGAQNSWIEFYIGATVPSQGTDYTDSKFFSMNTYSGCGTSTFDGDVVTIGCSGSQQGNAKITFAKTGTYYVVIKAGSAGGALNGVTVSDIFLDQ